jgi:N-methylhydantoinase B
VIFRALLPALPERLPAGTKAMMCHAGFGGVDPQTGEYYCFLETFGGGYGGRAGSDGPDAVQTHGQNTENALVEETELNYPVRVTQLSLVEDSDGPGRFRGGYGPPAERDPEAVARDVREGKVSPDRAREVYAWTR